MKIASILVLGTLIVAATAGAAVAADHGHFELVWFRMWDKSENAQAESCIGHHVMQVWVFNENGSRMPNVAVLDQNGAFRGATSASGERAEIALFQDNDLGFHCAMGSATSDATPIVTVALPPCWGHYSYDAGFVYKTDADTAGDADTTLIGELPERGDIEGEYGNPVTQSMVYSHQNTNAYLSAATWQLHATAGTAHSQTFVTTGVNRILGAYLFPVQSGNLPTVWRMKVHYGGPDGPVIATKTTPFAFYFAQPLAFSTSECPVVPNHVYTITLEPIDPPICNVYTYPGTYYPNGQYYFQGTPFPNEDMYGFVWGWDAGVGQFGIVLGTIRDTNSNPIKDATVTLTNQSTSEVMTTSTSASGVYIFPSVAAGTYCIDVERPGFTATGSCGHVVVADQVTQVDFTLNALVQELSNTSFENGLYAWTTYGTRPPQVWRRGIEGAQANTGDHWAGIVYPGGAANGGMYQRVDALVGESYQAVFNAYTVGSGMQIRIGVDRTGGTDRSSGAILWSAWSSSPNNWSPANDGNKRVDFVATGPKVTVFVDYIANISTSVLAIDDVAMFRVTGPAPSSEKAFAPGWTLASAPRLDAAGEPVTSVFDGLILGGNVLSGNLFRFDTPGDAYEAYSAGFTNMERGRGYWLNIGSAASNTHAGLIADDVVSRSLDLGWNLVGQPYGGATALADVRVRTGSVPAWRDDVNVGKVKYRSDSGTNGWIWQENSETAIEWRLWVSSTGSTSGSQPRLLIRDGLKAEFQYNPAIGAWSKNDSGMSIVSGGANGRVYMGNDEWHTMRLDYNSVTHVWRITVDGLTDPAHHMEGVATSSTGDQYAQWGVVSSDATTDVYTNYVYWGQGAEIDNWPADKKYNANPTAPEVVPGWGAEVSGSRSRSFTTQGSTDLTLASAAAAGLVQGAAVYYDDGYRVASTAGGDDNALRPWSGYWIKANQTGLTLRTPGAAEPPSPTPGDLTSRVRLRITAPDCLTSTFDAAMAASAADTYEAGRDVALPPPAPTREVSFSTTLDSVLMLEDVRPEPASGAEKVWACTAIAENFATDECRQVTIQWDLADVGAYGYKLVDVGGATSVVMEAAGSHTFEICEGEALSFEIRAKLGGYGGVAADLDDDGDVDLTDFALFLPCFNGPGRPPAQAGCEGADLDGDTDVDLADFGLFLPCFNGPSRPPACS